MNGYRYDMRIQGDFSAQETAANDIKCTFAEAAAIARRQKQYIPLDWSDIPTSQIPDLPVGRNARSKWQLALNIDTSDGNVVDYVNEEFWESFGKLGTHPLC